MNREKILSKIAYFYIWFTKNTLRLKEIDLDGKVLEQSVYAIWHGDQILPLCLNPNLQIAAMCSTSKDGEIQAGVLKDFGFIAVRGSSSNRAERALIEALRYAKKGHSVCFTVDGPKGPIYKVKPGLLMVAQKVGIRLIPISAVAQNSLIFNKSWDKFKVPLPFSKTVAIYGHAIRISKTDNLEEVALIVEKELNALSLFANKYYWSKNIKEYLKYHPRPKFLVIKNKIDDTDKSVIEKIKNKYNSSIVDLLTNNSKISINENVFNLCRILKHNNYDVVINLDSSIKSKIISYFIKSNFITKNSDTVL